MSAKVKGEKFPLAAQRVVVEFKLGRAKGCNISKLWPKKEIKAKIAVCYEKEEAAEFEASNNWFQRFKTRHGVAEKITQKKVLSK